MRLLAAASQPKYGATRPNILGRTTTAARPGQLPSTPTGGGILYTAFSDPYARAAYPRLPTASLVGRPTTNDADQRRRTARQGRLADDGDGAAGRGAPAEVRPGPRRRRGRRG
jgi:hypothetical protein